MSEASRMRLYYNNFSPNARRAVMVVHHLDAPVELVLVRNIRDPEERARVASLNPNVKIPVLEHGDFSLWESLAIMQYVADQVPGQTIYPTGLRERADVNRWLFWSSHHWTPAVAGLSWERVLKKIFGMGDPDPHEVERAERELARFGQVLDVHLAGREWISGPGLTIADIAIATPLMRKVEAALPIDGYSHMLAWFDRVRALDAWKRSEP
jgi:glutathione S-transferase